ncbi:MAG: aminodeoxychorismate/anthranilate synthase component II [Planctomycetales bacterium]|nr:aminodeoxychorismate/anthranilate synthase component II [Planctomycetales bacterium]
MILLIDNYDSFVHNLARYFQRLGQRTHVVRNDQLTVNDIRTLQPDAVVISPGPCDPDKAGISLGVVTELHASIPILGVCLGHQVIAQAFGAQIRPTKTPMHGRASQIVHDASGIFQDIPNPTTVARYHSLIAVEHSMPSELHVSARTEDGTVMAIRHKTSLCVGLQFHPESILTTHGFQMLRNFLRMSDIDVVSSADFSSELVQPRKANDVWPERPVTF